MSGELAELIGASRARSAAMAKALLSGCLSRSQLLAPLVLLSAVLVRALSLRLGQNVLTVVVEAVVVAFEAARDRASAAGVAGAAGAAEAEAAEHECSNAALLLAHLYNLGAVHASRLYELIRRLTAASAEADLQLLIVILRAVGPQLRSDDPAALKEIILDVQSKAAAGGGAVGAAGGGGARRGGDAAAGGSARGRVFLSMLMDLKNNKQKARDGGGGGGAAAADGALGRLRKWLKTLSAGGLHDPRRSRSGGTSCGTRARAADGG